MALARTDGLEELFQPKSIAVIGASNRPGSVGTTLFRNILQASYRGVVYPVNPSWPSVSGVHGIVEELGRAGSRGVIVISSGFREVGGAGIALEEELVRTAQKYHMSLVGPNCFGLLNTDPTVSLNATFSENLPPRGNIAFVSQSGALCAGILAYGIAERIGFSQFVSVGNRAGIDENDLLRSLGRDPATRVILLYVESLANGRRFLEAAREVTEVKPVLVIKSGRTPAGERAARSHTGSLAQSGRDQLYDALFEQSGVIRVESIGELFRNAKVFSAGMRLDGPRLSILTNSGGPGIVAADAAGRRGLELPLPSETETAQLAAILSPYATIANPVDMTADGNPTQWAGALRIILDAPRTDGAMVISTPTGTMTGAAVAKAILEAHARSPKALTACLFGLTDLSEDVAALEAGGIPTFTFPEEAVQGLGSLAKYRSWLNRPRTEVRKFPVDLAVARAVLARARRDGVSVLPEYAARELLTAYGIPFASVRRVRTADEAVAAADEIGYPVVLKVASPDISHKTEVGGVLLHLEDANAVRAAHLAMTEGLKVRAPTARIEGFEVETEVRGGKEVLIGLQRDPGFGPVVVFGLGGIYVEVLRDVTFRLAPVRTLSAVHMIESVKAFPLLQGVRGEPASDLAALAEVIERVSQLAVDLPEVAEMDLNPLIVRRAGAGVVAVDARVVLAPPSTPAPSV